MRSLERLKRLLDLPNGNAARIEITAGFAPYGQVRVEASVSLATPKYV
jgi:hypothetical protein